MSYLSTIIMTLSAPFAAADSDLPDWLQSLLDFLGQVIAEIPLIILDIIEFIVKLIIAAA